jgi:hypothetical protein
MKGVQAFAEGRGYPTAPMSMLHLNYREPDLTLQKGLNDFSKRHHVRLWDTQARWGDEEVWVGAGTRDIAFAYFRRRGSPITHRIEQDVDQERDKIVNDLSFTPCVDSVGLVNRPDLARVSRNGTGDLMTTDGQVAIVHLAACAPVSLTAAASDELPIRASGNVGYRFARREILWFRNDMLRNNVYWRGFEGGWWLFSALRRHFRPSGLDPDPCYREPPSSPALASITRADPIPHHEVADLPVDCCRPAGGIRSGTFDSEPRLR